MANLVYKNIYVYMRLDILWNFIWTNNVIKTLSSLSLLQFLSEKGELDTWKEKKIILIVAHSAFNDWHDMGSA